ncbi:hypothetical protein PTKIN_Ptkin06aG0206500 [Pterospermum kingtungense]
MAAEGKVITVLSIDGGGVRGLIPAKILDVFETYIQKEEGNENARLADYFDFIAGTSTGGLITAMLTTPDYQSESKRSFTAKQIVEFYHTEARKIFPDKPVDELKQQPVHKRALVKKSAGKAAVADSMEVAEEELVDSMVPSEESAEKEQADSKLAQSDEEALIKLANPILHSKSLSIFGFNPISALWNTLKGIVEKFLPHYNAEGLEKAIKEKVGERKLSETLTNVVIPSYDIKLLQPTVFSTLKAKHNDLENPKLVDVCLSTSAVPYFLPHRKFGFNSRLCHMVDGGVAANNPTLLALSEAAKEMSADGKVKCLKDIDCNKVLVLSLGTGSSQENNDLDVTSEHWGPLNWLIGNNGVPLLDVLMTAMDDMTDIYLAAFFGGTSFDQNYLRIQTHSLRAFEIAMDNSNALHLKNLERIGEELLKKPVSAVNLETGSLEPIKGPEAGTNEDKLKSFGDKLIAERKRRLGQSCN